MQTDNEVFMVSREYNDGAIIVNNFDSIDKAIKFKDQWTNLNEWNDDYYTLETTTLVSTVSETINLLEKYEKYTSDLIRQKRIESERKWTALGAFNKIRDYETHLNSIWVNEMKQHEYNPAHIHRGTLFTGLSSVMILKLPSTYGKEYSNDAVPQNGRLQILGASNGQFAKIDYQPPMDLRDFYVFPYDMRHCVYPFNGTTETRRTLAANCDVQFDPIKNRGAM